MLDFDRFAYHTSALPKDESEKKEFFKKLEEQFQEELKNSEHAQEYFSKYNPSNIESFIKSYASRKVHLTQCYRYYANAYHQKEISELEFQAKAEHALEIILQKKLFDIQIRWRAGQLQIDDIKTSRDFNFWEKHILSCSFIPLVKRNEVELMKEYLLHSDEDEDFDRYYQWQDYDDITEKDENGLMSELPDWYEFYDLRMGTGALLNLPNAKGEKEEFYFDLIRKENSQNNPPKTYPPQLPLLFTGNQELYDFCKYFETDKYFTALFKYDNYHYEKANQRPNYDDVLDAIDILRKADRPISCNRNLNWDEALLAAAREYTNTKTVEMLDFVYEQYLMMKDLGMSGGKTREEIEKEWAEDWLTEFFRQNILNGRKLNGEPEDFDY
jgi:hypothetical protein